MLQCPCLGRYVTCSLKAINTYSAARCWLQCHLQPCLALQASWVFFAVWRITPAIGQVPTVLEMYSEPKVGAQIASLKGCLMHAAAIQYSGPGTGWLWRGVVHANCCCIRQQCCSIRRGGPQSAASWSHKSSTCACLTMLDWCWIVKWSPLSKEAC